MPKETFLKLPEEKRKLFIEGALKEFSQYNYEIASINRIIKNIGIARGSVYQYFEDKLDLWLYLKEYSEQQKIKYIQEVSRAKFSTFWDYYKALFINGIDFDLEQPFCSRFLYRVGFKENSEAVSEYLDSWKEKANEMFTQWIEFEKKQGSFNANISTELIVHFVITMSLSIADLLQKKYKVDFDQNLKDGKPLFGANKKELAEAVTELIQLLEKALK
jgi:AcrR family transcriptional regulator